MDRRKFLIGSATAAAAVITPIAVLASDEAATVIPPKVSKFLSDVMLIWDDMSARLSYNDIIRTGAYIHLDPDVPSLANIDYSHLALPLQKKYGTIYSYDPKDSAKELLITDSVFVPYNDHFTMYYQVVTDADTFEKKWYTVTLMDHGQNSKPIEITEIQPNIQKYVDYETKLAEGNNENVKKIFWDK